MVRSDRRSVRLSTEVYLHLLPLQAFVWVAGLTHDRQRSANRRLAVKSEHSRPQKADFLLKTAVLASTSPSGGRRRPGSGAEPRRGTHTNAGRAHLLNVASGRTPLRTGLFNGSLLDGCKRSTNLGALRFGVTLCPAVGEELVKDRREGARHLGTGSGVAVTCPDFMYQRE